MSSSSTQRVGRAPKDKGSKGQYSPQGTKPPPDGPKAPDGVNPKNQPTAEQMRIAQITYDVNKSDDPDLQRKIEQVMELTGKTADTVLIALHDCDNETERAVDMLLEGDQNESEWETSGKKKKNRQPTSQKPADSTPTSGGTPNNKDKENRDRGERQRDNKREGGFRIRGPPRLTRGSGRNWRNKENEKNEKNLEENKRERNPEGRFRGARRGARGRGSGRVRTFQNRGLSNSGTCSSSFPQSIDTWTNSTVEQTDSGSRVEGNMPVGNWSEFTVPEDWSEEDWNESLTETKVFTPSTGNQPPIEVNENTRTHLSQSIDLATLLQKPEPSTTQSSLQSNGILQSHHSSSVSQSSSSQSQFSLSQYAQQAAESIKAAVGITSSMNSSSAPPFSSSVFTSSDNEQSSIVQLPSDLQHSVNNHTTAQQVTASLTKTSALPQRNKTQKPRIPPPSKIPESAVEMPDNAIMALDVQFGALEFGVDSSPFDFTNLSDSTTGYQDSPLNSMSHMNSQPVTGSHTGASNSSASMSSSLSSSLSKETSFGLGGTSSSTNHSSIAKDMPPSSVNLGTQPSKVSSVPESLLLGQQQERKSVGGTPYTNQRTASSATLDGSYSAQKASLLGSGSNNYIHQNSSLESPSLLGSSNSQNSYMSVSQSHGLSASSAPYNMQSMQSYVPPPNVTYPSQAVYTQQNTPYSYSAQQGYSGSNSSTNHAASLASAKLSGSLGHGVELQAVSQHSYDTNSTSGLTAATTGNSGLSGSNISGSSSLGLASTSSSTTTTSVLKNSLSASKTLPTMPPGVPAAMMSHQYIMSQAGLPFYGLQQPLYTSSYEEMQMLPSRLQPLGYYDMQFPTATSLTGRDPNLGSVAYTGDIKYSRADTDVSSVATTLSQGQAATQAHGQTFLNPAALPHGYGYYFHSMPGGLHPYGTPIFPVPAATNTHGASSSTQYQKTSFGSHSYGEDSLFANPTNILMAPNAHTFVGTGTATDLSNSIYSKAHTQLAKSFEKPGFHAGTPPPFNMAATQPAGPIGASSTPYAATPFIPVIAHGQHHSTMLHHLQQDSSQQGTPSGGVPQRSSQQSMGQQKGTASSKQNFPYWNNN